MPNLVEITVRVNDDTDAALADIERKFKDSGGASGSGFSDEFDKASGGGLLGAVFGKGEGTVTSDAEKAGQDVGQGLSKGMLAKFQSNLGSGLLSSLFGTSAGEKLFSSAGNTVTTDASRQGELLAQGLGKGLTDGFSGAESDVSGVMSGLFSGDPGGSEESAAEEGHQVASSFSQGLAKGFGNITSSVGGMISGLFGGSGADIEREAETVGDDASKGLLRGMLSNFGGGSGGGILGSLFSGGAGDAESAGEQAGKEAAAGAENGLMSSPWAVAGIGGAIAAAAPFIAQMFSGLLVTSLGLGIVAMAVYGASHSKDVTKAFDTLKTDASKDLTDIGASFVPVVTSILANANSMLNKLTPVFAGAAKTISGPFQQASDTIIKSFGSTAVSGAINAVAKAFAAILTAVTPQLASDIEKIAGGITDVANSVAKNPQAYAGFLTFFADVVTGSLKLIAALTNVATYLEKQWPAVWSNVGGFVKGTWTIIVSTAKAATDSLIDIVKVFAALFTGNWTALWNAAKSLFTANWNSIESTAKIVWTGISDAAKPIFNGLASFLSGVMNSIESHLHAGWSSAANTVTSYMSQMQSKITSVWNSIVSFFGSIPGRVMAQVSSLGSSLKNFGASIMNGFLSGIESIWTSIVNFFKNLPSDILHALGIKSPPAWAIQAGKDIMSGLGIGMSKAQETAASAATALKNKVVGGTAGIPATGNSTTAQQTAMKMAALVGWTGAEWTALNDVAMRESGWSMTAQNPTSGAYGIAQFIDGPSEYAQYGGNSNTLAGQLTAFFNYIKQRYGDPIAAENHEEQFGWYAAGGTTSPGWAMVGERGRELVKLPGGARVYPNNATEQMVAGGAAGPSVVQLEIAPGGDSAFEQFMLTAMRNWVRIKGGGSVQKALGYGTG